ncbi:hypothetical protein L484_020233 [Morus notabilis]|uniref:SHSP domain-containing protein n=1 Tax=Morus notabilis TaxID=981085 RepID=W9RY10_9ROSA|nr:inactive protein RESTRICTED TEV MOVEMENT 2 [Morus notabilis]EXB97683.1 hypothetical protein L484_020233 [Morus notabilis]
MAFRQQRVGGITGVRPREFNRPVYEDFQPQIETNEEEGAHIVDLRFPGFIKEQLKITYEAEGNNIRVRGQRPLGNNRWSRLNQLLPVPHNCDVNKIHAKFHNGILTITMPKDQVLKPALVRPKEEKPAEKATPESSNEPAPPKASETKVVPPSSSEPSQKAAAAAEQQAEKGQEQTKDARNADAAEQTSQTVTSAADHKGEKLRDEKKMAPSLSSKKGIVEPERQKGVAEETLTAQQEIADEKRVVATADTHKYTSETKRDDESKTSENERLKEPKKTEIVAERSLDKEKENTQKGKGSFDNGKKAVGDFVSGAAGEEKPERDDGEVSNDGNKLGIRHAIEGAKQTVTGAVRKLNDGDRQMLINIGVAVLTIVAVGAYVSHSFVSSNKRPN